MPANTPPAQQMLSLCIPDLPVSNLFRNSAGFLVLGVVRAMPVTAARLSLGRFAVREQQCHRRRTWASKEFVWVSHCQRRYVRAFNLPELFSLPFQTQHEADYPAANPHHGDLITRLKTALVDCYGHGNGEGNRPNVS
jgi:hypothetical protein